MMVLEKRPGRGGSDAPQVDGCPPRRPESGTDRETGKNPSGRLLGTPPDVRVTHPTTTPIPPSRVKTYLPYLSTAISLAVVGCDNSHILPK